jgi:hypothetical protein
MQHPPKPHYQCFKCFRSLGFGYDRTARIFKVKKKAVHRWFKYHGVEVQRVNLKSIRPSKQRKKSSHKPIGVKISSEEWVLRKGKSVSKRKLVCYLRAKVWKAFTKEIYSRTAECLIGCNMDDFKRHIASLLKDGMTMSNYGKHWHLDHIIPCKAFNLFDSKERLQCFHFSNYQPLEASENLRKSSKISGPTKGGYTGIVAGKSLPLPQDRLDPPAA